MDCRLHLVLIFCFVHLILLSSQHETGFVYNGFDQADLFMGGVAKILRGGLLQLTNGSERQIGHAFFKQPFDFGPSKSLSFCTQFVCALVPPKLGAPIPRGDSMKLSPLPFGIYILLAIHVLTVLGGVYWYRRNKNKFAEVIESWEKEYVQHRFSYKSLYKATNGFGKNSLVGQGGFGKVHRGSLPLSRSRNRKTRIEKSKRKRE